MEGVGSTDGRRVPNAAADSSRTLRRYLRDRWKDAQALFPSRSSDRITDKSVNRNVVKRAAKAAGVEPQVVGGGRGDPTDVSAHTLRHSVAYRIIQEEGGRPEDDELVGIITADDLTELLAEEHEQLASVIQAQRPSY